MVESRSEPRPKPDLICWECGATNDPGSSECWLCQRRDWNRYPAPRARRAAPLQLPRRGPLSTIAGLMIGIAILGVAIGLFREAPGLTVFLLISVAPALAITELKARGRYRRGDPMSIGERILRVVVLMILIPILVVLALVVALFAYCAVFMR
jgi:hypothetical protein